MIPTNDPAVRSSPPDGPPRVVSAAGHAAFEAQALRMGLDPGNRWIGAYVEYEWDHLRHILDALPVSLDSARVLEFGCNVGASAVVQAQLGAQVTAVDVEPEMVELARFNARRYGHDAIDFQCVPDTRRLPFADHAFDLVSCNSVLEYVGDDHLAAVQREIDRVLRPGGTILVCGTSNRLWPVEVHSRRFGVNYLPRWLDRWRSRPVQRGLWPWTVRFGFGAHYGNLDDAATGDFYRNSRQRMATSRRRITLVLGVASFLRVGPGLLTPSLSCVLRKNR